MIGPVFFITWNEILVRQTFAASIYCMFSNSALIPYILVLYLAQPLNRQYGAYCLVVERLKMKTESKTQAVIFWYKLQSLEVVSSAFILERGFAGFPQFEEKKPHKIYFGASNGAHKIVPKNKY